MAPEADGLCHRRRTALFGFGRAFEKAASDWRRRASVARLLDQSWGKEPTWRRLYDVHGPARETPTAVRTYVAEGGGEVVGVATALVSVVHFPLRPLVVNVSPEWRRRGVGTRLVEQLGADPAVSGGPSFTRVPTGDEAGLRFSARLGLQPVNRAFGLEIDARSPAVEAWSTAQPDPSELGCTLRRPDQPGWPEAEVLLDFVHDGYRKSHERWTPCPGFPPERREKFFFSGVQPDSQVVPIRNGDLVAAASLRRDDVFGPDAFHLVFAYAADDAAPPARDLLGTVVAECLRYTARRPQKMVWELHETDTVGLFHAHRLDGRRRVDILLCGPPPGGDLERAWKNERRNRRSIPAHRAGKVRRFDGTAHDTSENEYPTTHDRRARARADWRAGAQPREGSAGGHPASRSPARPRAATHAQPARLRRRVSASPRSASTLARRGGRIGP